MTEEDIKLIEKFIEIRNRGYYADGGQVTDVYNRVLNKNLRPSNCGSCIRQRINELEAALKAYKAQNKAVETAEPITTPLEENKSTGEAENKPVKKAGRPKKS